VTKTTVGHLHKQVGSMHVTKVLVNPPPQTRLYEIFIFSPVKNF